jgi:hypothetical protein
MKQTDTDSKVFRIFEDCEVSVDVIASSDVSLSLTLDKKQREKHDIPNLLVSDLRLLYGPHSDVPFLICSVRAIYNVTLQSKLRKISDVNVYEERAIVTLISNLERSSEVMALAFQVMAQLG